MEKSLKKIGINGLKARTWMKPDIKKDQHIMALLEKMIKGESVSETIN